MAIPQYGSNITNFNPNELNQKQLADFGQQWWQATTKEQRDAIAKQAADFRASLAPGMVSYDPKTGKTTFNNVTPNVGGTTTNTGGVNTSGTNTGGTPITGSTADTAYMNAESQARGLAQSKVDRYMSEATASITDFLERLKSTREKGIRSAELSAEQQRRALQDRGFLQSRATQQAMTGRGMTGSGIAEDAQTRLALQGQQELSQLFSNLGQQKFGIEEQYRLAEEEKLRELQNLEANKNNLTEEEFQNALDRIYNRTNQRLSTLFQEAGLTGMYGGEQTLAGQQFSYQQARDLIGDEQWQKQFDENVKQFGLNYAINEAQVTGKFEGQDTLASQQFNYQKEQDKIANDNWNKQFLAEITGTYVDADGKVQKTTQQQQQELTQLWTLADQTGQIPPALAQFYGISPNTSTLAAKQLAQNASNQNVQTLLEVWRATGKAPKGLESYGVKEGQEFYTPEQKTQVGNSYAEQAASGQLKSNDFVENIRDLYGESVLLSGDPMEGNAVYSKPRLPKDEQTRYEIWGIIEDSGYSDEDLAQIYSSLGISKEEQAEFFEKWQDDYNKRMGSATTTTTTPVNTNTGQNPFKPSWMP